MNKKHRSIYIQTAVFHAVFVVCWVSTFEDRFPKPVFSCIGSVVGAHLFFLFGYFMPRFGFSMAREKGKLMQNAMLSVISLFITFMMFGIIALCNLVYSCFIGEYEKVIFFLIPLSLAVGLFSSWMMARSIVKNEN